MFILALGNSSEDKLSKAGHSNIKNNSCADVYSVIFFSILKEGNWKTALLKLMFREVCIEFLYITL
jgi:hypothetical protein